MKFINWWINRIAIGGLAIASALFSLASIILLLSLVFNFPPYVTFDNGHSRVGITDFRDGVPVIVDLTVSIPDTSIAIKRKGGHSYYNIWSDNERRYPVYANDSNVLDADTIVTSYRPYNQKDRHNIQVTGLDFGAGKAYVQTSSRLQKFIFSLPLMLKWLVIAYCAWQLAMLLSFIQSGEAFINRNYRRLSKVGWAIVALYLSLFLYGVLVKQFDGLSVSFSSTNPDYQAPFQINAYPDNDIGIAWLVTGCIILIVANAFQKGHKLQQEQDLTV